MRRRNFLAVLATTAIGSGSFIASGAFGTDSSGDDGNWVQASEIDDDQDGDVRVQPIVEPGNDNHGFSELERDDIGVTDSDVIQADDTGILRNISFESVNTSSTTRVGRVDLQGNVDSGHAAFLIANLGGVGDDGMAGRSVAVELSLYDGTSIEESSVVRPAGAIEFPYTIPGSSQSGELLESDGVVLAAAETICVALEIHAYESDVYDQAEAIGLTIREPDDEE